LDIVGNEMTTDYQKQYMNASLKTAEDLHSLANSASLRDLSALSLPEVEAAVQAVARVVPAGNIPAMILSGLARLPNRRPPAETVRRDVDLLFKGIEAALDRAVYGAFFAGPAAVIWGYQNLLRLAGKEPEISFPEGLWQFYAGYALREDTARFTVETHGFDTVLRHHDIVLSHTKRITAWVLAAIHCLHQYDDLLTNEWRERVYTYLLQELLHGDPQAPSAQNLYRQWADQRPYGRKQDAAPDENYAAYRRRKFDDFLYQRLQQLEQPVRNEWSRRVQEAKEQLPAYRQQMSILAYLQPTQYGERRQPFPLSDAHVGLIYQGRYYLLPACRPQSVQPPSPSMVEGQIEAILRQPAGASTVQLSTLATLPRQEWAGLRAELNETLLASLDRLRLAPILINVDRQSPQLSLSELRSAERGVGEHAVTIFDAQKSFIFDYSHIFFDGTGSAALAEMLTQEALAWANYLRNQTTAEALDSPPIRPLLLPLERRESIFLQQASRVAPGVTAETTEAQLKPILVLRKMFKMRNDLLQLTVNDLLILYRAIHAVTYRADPDILASVEALAATPKLENVAGKALEALERATHVPAILIPIDATKKDPKERIYPLVFEAPLRELDLLNMHQQTLEALETYRQAAPTGRASAYTVFDELQRGYLATLAGFGHVLARAREIATRGEGASQSALKLLAHLPTPLQRTLDSIPNRFDLLNNLIKGEEVFSNVGAVAPGSTLSRFSTARDDNDKKTLAWGVLTDSDGVMHLSLRDFRPHVATLVGAGQRRLAQKIAQHYLDTYARGLNAYVRELSQITRTSRETQFAERLQ
jgi:hypothetical protein